MNKHYQLIAVFLLLFSLSAFAQEKKAYFQQRVDYHINAVLDDKKHVLSCDMRLDYTNNSPDVLPEIYFNLWANAYSSTETAFAEQQRKDGKTDFDKASEKSRGGYTKLEFFQNGQNLSCTQHNGHSDMAKITLKTPLASGEKTTLEVKFDLKIPESFSRLGRSKNSYQLTQWYPKPAVYDPYGWQPMYYLDWGEFYSEFGSFDVKITLPADYVTGATGILQNEKEKKWLDELHRYTDNQLLGDGKMKYPKHKDKVKTLHYKQDNVHDFAVFLDKDFYVRKSNFSLPSGKNITAYSFFERDRGSSKMWLKANDYLRDAVLHYSEMLGEYPYDYVSAVENKASNGSGMEYPMITLIGQEATDFDLDLVITHEVGHNWFYGILASNEREHAWMDEGFNSFYESLYVLKKYPEKKLSGRYASFAKSLNFRHERYELSHYLRTLLLDRSNDKIGMCTSVSALPRADFYYILHYEKPASLLFYLRDYLGNEIFDKAMKAYYEKWKFKHPSPDDLREVLESVSQKKLDWLFNDLIKENKKAEFGITDCRKEGDFFSFTVIMNGTASAPVPVSFLSENDEVLKKVWIEPFKVRKEVKEEVKGAQKAVLDFDEVSLDIDRSNHECTSH